MKPNRNPSPRRAGNAALGSHQTAALAGGGVHAALDEFFRRVAIPEEPGCWLWTGHLDKLGYGKFSMRRTGSAKRTSAHRALWLLVYGPLPAEIFVLHRCDNPACVRLDHLFLGNHQLNMVDMSEKGRGTRGALPTGVNRAGARYVANVKHWSRPTYLGTFDTAEEAAAVAAAAREERNRRLRLEALAALEGRP